MGTMEISKSPPVVVEPSEPVTGTGDTTLSSYDKYLVSNPTTLLLVFEHPTPEPAAETIKRGLSRALVHYHPIAGRLAAGATAGDVVIRYTSGEGGVSFVAASASCAIKDVQDWSDPALKEELLAFYPAADGSCRFSDPLALLQVTVFSCGGFVLGVTWNHSVADGVGMAQFLQAVGELSRGLPSPSVVPARQRDSLALGPPPVFAKFLQLLGRLQPFSQMVSLDITIQPSLIQRVKDRYSSSTSSSGQPCSVFEAVAAVLWRCRTRAITPAVVDPEALTVLYFPSNARAYAGAEEGYYGNCLVWRVAMARADAVAGGDVVELVKLIRGAKGRVTDESDMDELLGVTDSYQLLRVTSWRNVGLEAADFGGGRPARVMGHWRPQRDVPKCTACIPCVEEYSVSSTCVKDEHAAAFLHELADMHLNYI